VQECRLEMMVLSMGIISDVNQWGVKDCYEWWFSGFNYFVQVG